MLSTALLLGAILVLITGKKRGRSTVISATALFALSLLAKETAIAGLPILMVIWFLYRDRMEERGHYQDLPDILVCSVRRCT